MHSLKNKAILYHVLFWSCLYLLWVIVFRSYSFTLSKTITVEFCYLAFITADYYLINDLLIPRFLFRKKYFLFATAAIFTIALSAWLRALVAVQMNLHFFHTPVISFLTLCFNSAINISLWVLLVTAGKMMVDRSQNQRRIELLEKEKIKNELDYLKAQINPHALFNSLNTIYGYIDKNNKVARNTLLQFSELLRYQLYDCATEKVSLEKELEYIRNYIAFQKLRKDEQLVVDLQIHITEAGLIIAPLLLVVLVENAFKFVSSSYGRENKIAISIATDGSVLHSTTLQTSQLISHETEMYHYR